MGRNVENSLQNHKHENKDNLCFHCNELKSKVEKLNIFNRGYMSSFDSMKFTIQICNDCMKSMCIDENWFDNENSINKQTGEYLNESYIFSLIETFPVENQEYIYNSDDNDEFSMSREEWIEFNS